MPDENASIDTAKVRGDLNACATARSPFGRGAAGVGGADDAGRAAVGMGSGIALLIKDTGARNASIRGDHDRETGPPPDMHPHVDM
jgi:hypothetical protein